MAHYFSYNTIQIKRKAYLQNTANNSEKSVKIAFGIIRK